jgi:hypothetical protein
VEWAGMRPRSEMKVAIYLRVSTAEQTTENQLYDDFIYKSSNAENT